MDVTHDTPEETGEDEVYTGAELYLFLLRQNEEQLDRCLRRISEYKELQITLSSITDRCRRSILAPVAGGLGYFEADLDCTNTIMVLLGDGWFASRSASQARGIAERRAQFMLRELKVLQEEKATLEGKRDLFLSEMPEAEVAMAQLLERRERDLEVAHAVSSQGASSDTPSVPLPAPTTTACTTSSVTSANTEASRGDSSSSAIAGSSATTRGAVPVAGIDSELSPAEPLPSQEDEDLFTFDELDDLTEDELIEIERELGDHVDDEELVERIMTERMIAKKEKRVQAELARRREVEAAVMSPVSSVSIAVTSEIAEKKEVGSPTSASSAAPPVVPYTSPADIGVAVQPPVATPAPAASVSSTNSPKSKKRVSFAPEVLACSDEGGSKAAVGEGEAVAVAERLPLAPEAPSAEHRTYALGEIVDHAGAGVREVPPTLSPIMEKGLATTVGAAFKRKSLFQKQLDGEV